MASGHPWLRTADPWVPTLHTWVSDAAYTAADAPYTAPDGAYTAPDAPYAAPDAPYTAGASGTQDPAEALFASGKACRTRLAEDRLAAGLALNAAPPLAGHVDRALDRAPGARGEQEFCRHASLLARPVCGAVPEGGLPPRRGRPSHRVRSLRRRGIEAPDCHGELSRQSVSGRGRAAGR